MSRPTIRPSDDGTVAVSFNSWSLTFQVSTWRATGTTIATPWPTTSSLIAPKLLETPTSPSSMTTQAVLVTQEDEGELGDQGKAASWELAGWFG